MHLHEESVDLRRTCTFSVLIRTPSDFSIPFSQKAGSPVSGVHKSLVSAHQLAEMVPLVLKDVKFNKVKLSIEHHQLFQDLVENNPRHKHT